MAVLLDTTRVAQSDRAEAFDAAMRYATVPNQVTSRMRHDVHARIDLWDFGPASLLRQRGSGMRIAGRRRSCASLHPSASRSACSPGGAGSTPSTGTRATSIAERAELVLTDLTASHDYNRSGEGGSHCLPGRLRPARPARSTSSARPHRGSESSPLYDLVRDQVAGLRRRRGPAHRPGAGHGRHGHDRAGPSPDRECGRDEARTREAMADSLSTRITMYLQQHLADPDLSPARIARAHNISVRHLYNIWADRDLSLEAVDRPRKAGDRPSRTRQAGQPVADDSRGCPPVRVLRPGPLQSPVPRRVRGVADGNGAICNGAEWRPRARPAKHCTDNTDLCTHCQHTSGPRD